MRKEIDFILRMDAEDKRLLAEKAKAARISQAELIRRWIRNEEVAAYDGNLIQELKNLVTEINRIGTNINQIVHNVNMGKYTEYEKKKLFAMMQAVNDRVIELEDRLYNKK